MHDHVNVSLPNGSQLEINDQTCADFVYFRKIMRDMRRPDDNISHLLNKIDTNDPDSCAKLWNDMRSLHKERETALEFCIKSTRAKLEHSVDQSQNVLKKQVRMMPQLANSVKF